MPVSNVDVASILVCPDKFKGSATAAEVADALSGGIRSAVGPTREVVAIPLADGGDGTLAVLASQSGATVMHAKVSGPLGMPVEAKWAILGDGTAVIEMAQASGLALLGDDVGPQSAVNSTTFGTGELVLRAAELGVRRCIIAVGGSATTDGGVGALDALGWSLHGMEVMVACDVTTTFLDAVPLFSPQKGASEVEQRLLTQRLTAVAQRFLDEYLVDIRSIPRAGAAGGLAGGLHVVGASLVSGFELVARYVGLHEALTHAGVVVTGEGRLDHTSFTGKPVGEVLALATERTTPVHVACGSADLAFAARFASVEQIVERVDRSEAMRNPLPYLSDIGRTIGERISEGDESDA